MEKFKKNIQFIILGLLCCTFFYTCSTNSKTNKLYKQNKVLTTQVDSLTNELNTIKNSTISSEELQTRLELEGYKTSARNLYYNNAIVRTKERPDDIMRQYQEKIDELTKKLK